MISAILHMHTCGVVHRDVKVRDGDGEHVFFFKAHCVLWVFPKIVGKPQNGRCIIMENPMNKWMIWGYPYFRVDTLMCI